MSKQQQQQQQFVHLLGIQVVKLRDPQLAKRYGIKTFPALVYFRNGKPLTYDGELM